MGKYWLRNRGYLHLTPQLNVQGDWKRIHQYVEEPKHIARHHFCPLLYKTIRERRFKKISLDGGVIRAHSWMENGDFLTSAKDRPIHYATHIDAAIYAYYANEKLGEAYEKLLGKGSELSHCVTAYRKTPKGAKGKNNIDFAEEVFKEIKSKEHCVAIAMDIKSFFSSLDHKLLKREWSLLLGKRALPADHYNIFKSVTNFSYVDLDDFRVKSGGFDEYKLHLNRRRGVKAFYSSKDNFYVEIRKGNINIKKNQRRGQGAKVVNAHNGRRERPKCGIPQGLAISSVLANLYMLPFDRMMLNLVNSIGGTYRRYSDDIVIICDRSHLEKVLDCAVGYIKQRRLKISADKTEICEFRATDNPRGLTARNFGHTGPHDVENERGKFTYLGFSFDGRKILIKDKNISRYYRKMKQAVRRKVKRAQSNKEKSLNENLVLHRSQLLRTFSKRSKGMDKVEVEISVLQYDKRRKEYYSAKKIIKRKRYGNFHNYARRASRIMNEPRIIGQLRNSGRILEKSIEQQLGKVQDD